MSDESQRMDEDCSNVTIEDQRGSGAPKWIRWLEKCFQIRADDGSVVTEVTGYAMDGVARNPINLTGSYLGVSILQLALKSVGCTRAKTCTETVFGIKPSSLLTSASVIVGLSTAVTMPYIGAIIDLTNHRRKLGAYTAALIVAIMAVTIALNEKTWKVIYFLFIVEGYLSILHVTTTLAYLPGFTNDDKQMVVYTSLSNVKQAFATFIFFAFVTGLTLGFKLSSITTSRLASVTVTINGMIFFSYAWYYLFQNKGPSRKVDNKTSLFVAGMKQTCKTTRLIFTKYWPLKYFILSLPWSPEAGAGMVQSILITYMTLHLRMESVQIGICSFILFVFQIPGGYLAKYISHKYNPLIGLQLCLIGFTLNSFLLPVVCWGPEVKNRAYIFAGTWGITYGWLYPCQRVLYCTMTPKKQEAEIMGVFAFANQIIGWLPVIIFTAINEAGIKMAWGIFALGFLFLLSFFISLLIGNYDKAVAYIKAAQEEVESQSLSQHDEEETGKNTV